MILLRGKDRYKIYIHYDSLKIKMPAVNLEEKMGDNYELGVSVAWIIWDGFGGQQRTPQFRTADAIGMCCRYYGKPGSKWHGSAPWLLSRLLCLPVQLLSWGPWLFQLSRPDRTLEERRPPLPVCPMERARAFPEFPPTLPPAFRLALSGEENTVTMVA